MSSKMDNRVNNSRGISNKKNKRQLSPREKLEIKKKLGLQVVMLMKT